MIVTSDKSYQNLEEGRPFRETDPMGGRDPYSASKAAQEAIAISYWRAYKVPLILVNLMNNFGEMQSATNQSVQAVQTITGTIGRIIDRHTNDQPNVTASMMAS